MTRVAGLFAALLLTGCGGSDATLSTFAGTWQGHTRGLVITRAGAARESIYSGCCTFGLAVRFQLSDPKGTARAASATATVTAVRIGRGAVFTKAPGSTRSTGSVGLRYFGRDKRADAAAARPRSADR